MLEADSSSILAPGDWWNTRNSTLGPDHRAADNSWLEDHGRTAGNRSKPRLGRRPEISLFRFGAASLDGHQQLTSERLLPPRISHVTELPKGPAQSLAMIVQPFFGRHLREIGPLWLFL